MDKPKTSDTPTNPTDNPTGAEIGQGEPLESGAQEGQELENSNPLEYLSDISDELTAQIKEGAAAEKEQARKDKELMSAFNDEGGVLDDINDEARGSNGALKVVFGVALISAIVGGGYILLRRRAAVMQDEIEENLINSGNSGLETDAETGLYLD